MRRGAVIMTELLHSKMTSRSIMDNRFVKWHFILTAAFFMVFLSRWGYQTSDDLGYFLFNVLLLQFVAALKFPRKLLVFWLCCIMLIAQWIFHFTTQPINSPDAVNYYNYITVFDGFGDFISTFWADLSTNYLNLSIYNSFGFIYLPFYYLFNTTDPYLIVCINTMFAIITIYLFSKMINTHFKTEVNEKSMAIFLALSFLSPSLIYWSSNFLKDITIFLVCTVAVNLLLKKRYVLFFICAVIATVIRPYAIVPIICYYLVMKQMKKTALFGVLGSLLFVVYKAGILGAVNSLFTLAFTVLSPNPFSLSNWSNETFRTVESAFMTVVVLTVLYVFLSIKESRKFYTTCFAAIFIYNCVLTLISYTQINYLNMDYGFAAAADDLSRKKLMLVMLFYLMFAYAVTAVIERRKSKYKHDLFKHGRQHQS